MPISSIPSTSGLLVTSDGNAPLLEGWALSEVGGYSNPSQIATAGRVRIRDGGATGTILASASLGADEDLRESGWSLPVQTGALYVELTPAGGGSVFWVEGVVSWSTSA